MPAERVAMRQVREIIRLKFSAGISTRKIARRLGIGVIWVYGVPVGRANSPGYGHLKLPHLKIGRAADLRRVKQDVYFRSLQPRRGWGVERLEATAAKHSIYVT